MLSYTDVLIYTRYHWGNTTVQLTSFLLYYICGTLELEVLYIMVTNTILVEKWDLSYSCIYSLWLAGGATLNCGKRKINMRKMTFW